MPEWTAEQAREMAAKGGKAAAARRRAAAAKDPLAEIRKTVEGGLSDYVKELQAAAKGEGAYADLLVKDRVSINKFLFEWAAGRPVTRGTAPAPAEDEDEEPEDGFRLAIGGD